MPIVDQFKEIMQIHRQSQYSQFLLTFVFGFLSTTFLSRLYAIAILTKNVTLPSLERDHAVVFPIPAQHP